MKNNSQKVNRACVILLACAVVISSFMVWESTPTYAETNNSHSSLSSLFKVLEMIFGDVPGGDGGASPEDPPGGDVEDPIELEYNYDGTLNNPSSVPPTLGPPNESTIPGQLPPGLCTNLMNAALNKLSQVGDQVIPVYQSASAQTGVPWEYLAAIHYIETGGSFNPNGSLISGRPIGTPEPDQGDKIYGSLLETAIDAAKFFEHKDYIAEALRVKNGMSSPTEVERIAGQFAAYNSFLQGECEIVNLKYTGKTWSGIPDIGQCKGKSGFNPIGEAYVGDRHVYATMCLDSNHADMYFRFQSGGAVQHFTSRVGAIALAREIQKNYSETPATPSPPAGQGFLRNPTDSSTISNEMIQKCSTGNTTPLNNLYTCVPPLQSVDSRYKNVVSQNSIDRYIASGFTYFQCVHYAVALADEINGNIPRVDNACEMISQPENGNYSFYPRSSEAPKSGDLVVWNSSGGVCKPSEGKYGHIAYISEVLDANNVVIAEANVNNKGQILYRNKALSSNTLGWLRKK